MAYNDLRTQPGKRFIAAPVTKPPYVPPPPAPTDINSTPWSRSSWIGNQAYQTARNAGNLKDSNNAGGNDWVTSQLNGDNAKWMQGSGTASNMLGGFDLNSLDPGTLIGLYSSMSNADPNRNQLMNFLSQKYGNDFMNGSMINQYSAGGNGYNQGGNPWWLDNSFNSKYSSILKPSQGSYVPPPINNGNGSNGSGGGTGFNPGQGIIGGNRPDQPFNSNYYGDNNRAIGNNPANSPYTPFNYNPAGTPTQPGATPTSSLFSPYNGQNGGTVGSGFISPGKGILTGS